MQGQRDLLLQVYSILYPMVKVIKIVQAGNLPTGVEGYHYVMVARTTAYDVNTPRSLIDPSTNKAIKVAVFNDRSVP